MKFYKIKVASIDRLTPKSVQINFEIPDELKSDYSFEAGQYVTIEINGVRRDYSLCTSPLDDKWAIGVKEAPNGFISHFLNRELKVNDFLNVSTPNGRFGIPSKPDEKRTIMAFAGGSGITPILSVMKYTLQTEQEVNFYLFYNNKTPDETMFYKELKNLKKLYPKNLHIHYFFTEYKVEDWLYEGRIDAHKFQLITNQLIDINEVDETLICGPNEMIEVISNEVFNAGIIKKRIHFELFTSIERKPMIVEKETLDKVEVTVELDGEISTMVWDTSKNLIDAMLDQGLDAPYSCKGGICSSCMCILEEGEVDIKENYVLTDADEEEGIILACCTRPKSKKIKINFDNV